MFQLVRSFSDKLKRDDISAHAASAAFFMFLSIFPMLMMICSILPYTHITKANLMALVTDVMPSGIDPFAISVIEEMYEKSFAIISMSAFFAVWSAAKGMLALLRGLNSVQEVIETRNYFVLRLWCCLYTIIFMAVIVFTVVVIVFGNSIVQSILEKFPKIRYVTNLLMNVRYMFILTFMAIAFGCMYAFIPNRRNNLLIKLPGAVFASVGWTVFSWGFSIYVDRFGDFNMYGSLTTIVILMLWLYFCMYLLLLGDEINSFLHPLFSLAFVSRRLRKKHQKELEEKQHREAKEKQKGS